MRKLPEICGLLLLLFFVGSQETFACSCVGSVPCESFQRSDIVFKGRVVKTERFMNSQNQGTKEKPRVISWCKYRETYFEVLENYKGAKKGKTVKIYSGCGGGDCGYPFKKDETYVVFSSKAGITKKKADSRGREQESAFHRIDPDKLWTSICSGTVKLNRARYALEFLANRRKRGSGGKIFGHIYESLIFFRNRAERYELFPEKKIKIMEIGGDNIYYVTPNERGYFEKIVPAGTYSVSPVVPQVFGLNVSYNNKNPNITVRDTACTRRTIGITNNSEISGKVLNADGTPVRKSVLELFNHSNISDKEHTYVSIEEDGTFLIRGLKAGKYVIGMNHYWDPSVERPYSTTFFPKGAKPNDADVLRIGLGTKLQNLVFILPEKLPARKIKGVVFWKNGKPAANVSLSYKLDKAKRNLGKALTTDKNGRFEIALLENSPYKIRVWQNYEFKQYHHTVSESSKIITIDHKTEMLKIELNSDHPEMLK